MVRPGGLELPTFWFVGGNCPLHGTTAADNTQRNQQKATFGLGSRRTALYPVHGQSHGHFGAAAFKLSILPNNQVEQYGDFWPERGCSDFRTSLWIISASAHIPDVPLQIVDCVEVARTVRDSDRLLKSGKHAS
jgi:hypothetical protein